MRLREKSDGKRLVAKVSVENQTVTTKAGRTDLNDMPSVKLSGEGPWKLAVQVGEELKIFNVKKNGTLVGDIGFVLGSGGRKLK